MAADEHSPKPDKPQNSEPAPSPPAGGSDTVVLSFEAISQGHKELFITCCGETYRLQVTRNKKLLLTK